MAAPCRLGSERRQRGLLPPFPILSRTSIYFIFPRWHSARFHAKLLRVVTGRTERELVRTSRGLTTPNRVREQ